MQTLFNIFFWYFYVFSIYFIENNVCGIIGELCCGSFCFFFVTFSVLQLHSWIFIGSYVDPLFIIYWFFYCFLLHFIGLFTYFSANFSYLFISFTFLCYYVVHPLFVLILCLYLFYIFFWIFFLVNCILKFL